MPPDVSLNHVAILVPSVRKAADFIRSLSFQVGQEEVFEREGTKEIYVEYGRGNSLLLMEPIKDGAYQRALQKRGPGLHHLAVDVLNIELFIESIAQSCWLLHPSSVVTLKQSKTAYLARPGFPCLIEVQQKESLSYQPLFVDKIFLSFDTIHEKLLEPVGLAGIIVLSNETKFSLGEKWITIKDLL